MGFYEPMTNVEQSYNSSFYRNEEKQPFGISERYLELYKCYPYLSSLSKWVTSLNDTH